MTLALCCYAGATIRSRANALLTEFASRYVIDKENKLCYNTHPIKDRTPKMELVIHSRKLKKDVTYWSGWYRHGYIFTDIENGREGTLGNQICRGGSLMGSTMSQEGEDDFEQKCRRWHKRYISKLSYVDGAY